MFGRKGYAIMPQPVNKRSISFRLQKYFKVWWLSATTAVQVAFINRATHLLFFVGKALRLAMTLGVLLLIRSQTTQLGGYTTDQMIIFFLTYQLLDIVAQIAFRGVYMFSEQVRSGNFDFTLISPINPLFRALTGMPDVNDALFLIPNLAIMGYLLTQLDLSLTLMGWLWFALLFINSLLIVTSLHIVALSIGVLTTEVDGIIFLYRDLARLGQFPVSIYLEPMRSALFFIIPIGIMITIPAEVLLGLPPTHSVLVAFLIGAGSFWLSLRLWRTSLRHYTSASS
jgi:ABC-2 type transport system permease protein